VPCGRLGWPSRQFLSARKYTVSYRIVSYRGTAKRWNAAFITCSMREMHMPVFKLLMGAISRCFTSNCCRGGVWDPKTENFD